MLPILDLTDRQALQKLSAPAELSAQFNFGKWMNHADIDSFSCEDF